MEKTIRLQDLDCANCAAKIENAVKNVEGVIEVNVNFLSQKMILKTSGDNCDKILNEVKKLIKKVDSNITVLV